jgi:hypothetical protein
MDQVAKWSAAQLKEFWSRWYFPANATLYVVGDLDRDVEGVQALIQKVCPGGGVLYGVGVCVCGGVWTDIWRACRR